MYEREDVERGARVQSGRSSPSSVCAFGVRPIERKGGVMGDGKDCNEPIQSVCATPSRIAD